jgi:hypothetical protein
MEIDDVAKKVRDQHSERGVLPTRAMPGGPGLGDAMPYGTGLRSQVGPCRPVLRRHGQDAPYGGDRLVCRPPARGEDQRQITKLLTHDRAEVDDAENPGELDHGGQLVERLLTGLDLAQPLRCTPAQLRTGRHAQAALHPQRAYPPAYAPVDVTGLLHVVRHDDLGPSCTTGFHPLLLLHRGA